MHRLDAPVRPIENTYRITAISRWLRVTECVAGILLSNTPRVLFERVGHQYLLVDVQITCSSGWNALRLTSCSDGDFVRVNAEL